MTGAHDSYFAIVPLPHGRFDKHTVVVGYNLRMLVFDILKLAFHGLASLVSSFYFQWGLIYARWGQTNRALWYFTRAIWMNRRGDRAYFHRGLLFAAVGMPERAIGDFSAAIENNPRNVNARIYRSMMYTITGRDEQAQNDLEQAVALGADREELEQQMYDTRTRAGHF